MAFRSWMVPVSLVALLWTPPEAAAEATQESALGPPAQKAEEREASLLFNTASRLYRQKNWREAAQAFGDFLSRFPRHAEAPNARFLRGYCLNRLGQHAGAAQELRAALESLRGGEAPWAADASFYHGRSLEALAGAEPESSKERRDLLLAAAKSYGEAARLHSRPRPAPPQGAGPSEEAEPEPAGSTTSPSDLQALALTSQGKALYQAGAFPEASKALSPLLEKEVEFRGSPHLSRGLYLLALSRYSVDQEAALGLLEKLAGGDPKDPVSDEAAHLLAQHLHRKGDRARAIPLYERVAGRQGARAVEAALHHAIALHERQGPGDLEQATGQFSEFIAGHPGHALLPRARFYEALCLFDQKKYDQAATKLERIAREVSENSGQAWLRLGQSLLLKDPPDAKAAAGALEKALEVLRKEAAGSGSQAGSPATGEGEQVAALYWHGKALLAQGGEALVAAARIFDEVAERHRASSPELAENALHQEAHALFLSGRIRECAALGRRYRERYPKDRARFLVESLKLSAECALHGSAGELDEEDRRAAPRFYREAASLVEDPAESRRLRYLSGVELYHQGDHRAAAEVLSQVHEESLAEPLPGFEEPDLRFFLANSLVHGPQPEKAGPEDLKRWKRAAELYGHYLKTKRDGAQAAIALFNLGLCRVWLGERAAARKSFHEFLEEHAGHPRSPQVRYELATLHQAEGDLEAASAEYGRAAAGSAEPELAVKALLQAVFLERRLGRPDQALAAFEEIERKLPSSPQAVEARLELAKLHLETSAPEEALALLEPIVETSPARAERDQALYLLAWCFRGLAEAKGEEPSAGYRKEEEDAYRKLIAEHPGSAFAPEAMFELAQRLFNRREYPEAKKWFRSALESAEREPSEKVGSSRARDLLEESLLGLGLIASQEQDHRQARDLLDRAAAERGELEPRALFHAARAWKLSGGEAQAVERYERLVGDLEPRASEYREESLLSLGECYHRLGKYPEAVKILERMLREFPGGKLGHEGLFALGFAHQFEDDFEAATRAYRQVVTGTRAVVAARAQYHLGECFMDQGKHREAAREFLTVAANFDFEGPYRDWVRRALLGAGLAYQAAGDHESAAAQYQELVQRFPDTEEGKAAASRLLEVKR